MFKKNTDFILTAIFIFLILGAMGCSSIGKEYGYSFVNKKSNDKVVRVSCAELKYYFSDTPVYSKQLLHDDDIKMNVRVSSPQISHWYTVGPGIMLPLPVIPWPFGILGELFDTEKPLDDTLYIWISITAKKNSYQFNPYLISLRNSQNIVFPSKVTDHRYPNKIKEISNRSQVRIEPNNSHYYRFQFNINDLKESELDLEIKGFYKNKIPLVFRIYKLKYDVWTRAYWLAGVNC